MKRSMKRIMSLALALMMVAYQPTAIFAEDMDIMIIEDAGEEISFDEVVVENTSSDEEASFADDTFIEDEGFIVVEEEVSDSEAEETELETEEVETELETEEETAETEMAETEVGELLFFEEVVEEEAAELAAEAETGLALQGSGTAEDPFMINNADELILFRDSVNAGETTYNEPGKYVALGDDIDLKGVDWSVNIGDDCNATFDGIFDGKNHTISNLTGIETAAKADGYFCTGLFGAINGNAVIKNLTIDNVTISTGDFNGMNAGAVVGFAYEATGSVENVAVTGNININALNISGAGAIVGYAYYGSLTVKNCAVVANDGSVINSAGDDGVYTGGIVGYGGKTKITNCTVENIDIASLCCAAGVTGLVLGGGTVTECNVKDVNVTTTHVNWKNSAAIAVGAIVTNTHVADITYSNVALNGVQTDRLVGVMHANKPTAPLEELKVRIGDAYYASLDQALAAAGNGEEIDVLVDMTLAGPVSISGTVILDLNGHTIAGTDNATASFGLFNMQPGSDFTVKDTAGNGAIKLTAENNRGWNAYSSVISNQRGNLTVNGGTIEHLGGTDMAYGIDNLTNGKGTYAETTINGGTVKSVYRAVRQFLNGVEANNILTVNGGTISGENKSIWVQDPSKNANTGTLTVGANAVINGDIYLFVTAGSAAWPVTVSIADKALAGGSKITTGNLPKGYFVEENGGIWNAVYKVAEVDGVPYETIQEAFAEAKDGSTVTLCCDIDIAETLVVPEGKALVLDMNGFTLTGTPAAAAVYAVISNFGTLTVTDGGKIICNHTLEGSTSYAVNTITNCGKLTIENVTVENNSTASYQIGYAIDNNSTSRNAVTVINGGEVKVSGSNYYDAIRLFCNSLTCENTVTVNGGKVSSIWMQNPSDGSAGQNSKDVKGAVNITGGTVDGLYLEPSAAFEAAITGGYTGSVSYFAEAEGRDLTGFITGGTFGMDVTEFCAEDLEAVKAEGETYYTIQHVTKATAATYAELETALAKDYIKEIKVTKTIDLSEVKVLDLKGKTVTETAGGSVFTLKTAGANVTVQNGTINVAGDAFVMGVKGSEGNLNVTLNLEENLNVTSTANCCVVVYDGTLNTKAVLETPGTDYAAVQGSGNPGNEGTTINVLGGSITAADGAIYHPQNGTLNVTGGTLTGATGIYAKAGQINVTGGTIKGICEEHAVVEYQNGMTCTGDALALEVAEGYGPLSANITGGTFVSEHGKAVGSYATKDGEEALAGFITGGLFSSDVTALCAADLETVKAEGETYYAIQYVTKATAATYAELEAALAKDYIKVVEVTAPIDLSDVTVLDLKGKTVTETAGGSVFTLTKAGTNVTVQNGTINVAGDAFVMGVKGSEGNLNVTLNLEENLNVTSTANCCVVVYDGTLNTKAVLETPGTDYAAVQGSGNPGNEGTTINVLGGSITAADGAIYHPQNGTLNVTGGTLTGATGIYAKAGQINVTGGTIKGICEEHAVVEYQNGMTCTGDALALEVAEGYGPLSANITGGTFVSEHGKAVGSYVTKDGEEALTGFITGGLFSTDVTPLCAEGYNSVLKDGSYEAAAICVNNGHGTAGWTLAGQTVSKKPTCTVAGKTTYTYKCNECGVFTKTETKTDIKATGHKAVTDKAVAATCTKTGKTAGSHCSVCKTVLKAQTTVAKLGHSYGNYVQTKAPTLTATGLKVRTCKRCGHKDSAVIAKLKASIEVPGNLKSLTVKKGKTVTFKLTLTKGDSLVSCKSKNDNFAKVTKVNKNTAEISLKAVKKGTTSIVITTKYGSKTYSVNVITGTVKTTGISAKVDTDITLAKGKTLSLKGLTELTPFTSTQEITYKSSNKKIVSVTSAGKIKAVKAGTAKITAQSGDKKVVFKVTVPGIDGVKTSLTLKVNKSSTLKPVLYGITGKATFTSSKKTVAAVDANGKITALKKGKATITVKAGSYSVKCNVTVK